MVITCFFPYGPPEERPNTDFAITETAVHHFKLLFFGLTLLSLGTIGCDAPGEPPVTPDDELSVESWTATWMTSLKEQFGEAYTGLKLSQLIIPGTHDSASGGLEQGDSIVAESVIGESPKNPCEDGTAACDDVCSCTNCADDCTDCSSDCSDCSDSCSCSCPNYCDECKCDCGILDVECEAECTKCGVTCAAETTACETSCGTTIASCKSACVLKVGTCKTGCATDFAACHTKCGGAYAACETSCGAQITACKTKAAADFAACTTTFSANYTWWATKKGAWQSQIGPYVVTRFAKTQSKTLVEQFRAGARYFDLRVYVDDDSVLKFKHGPVHFHSPAKESLADLATAISGTDEIIILQVSHFASTSEQHSKIALETLTTVFGDALIKASDPQNMSIGDLLKQGQVLVFMDDAPKDGAAVDNKASTLWSPWKCSGYEGPCKSCWCGAVRQFY